MCIQRCGNKLQCLLCWHKCYAPSSKIAIYYFFNDPLRTQFMSSLLFKFRNKKGCRSYMINTDYIAFQLCTWRDAESSQHEKYFYLGRSLELKCEHKKCYAILIICLHTVHRIDLIDTKLCENDVSVYGYIKSVLGLIGTCGLRLMGLEI